MEMNRTRQAAVQLQPLDNCVLEKLLSSAQQSGNIADMLALMQKLVSSEIMLLVGQKGADDVAEEFCIGRVHPRIMRRADGAAVLPVYTSAAQLSPENRNAPQMQMPFLQCADLAWKSRETVSAIIVNPWSNGLLLPQAMLKHCLHLS